MTTHFKKGKFHFRISILVVNSSLQDLSELAISLILTVITIGHVKCEQWLAGVQSEDIFVCDFTEEILVERLLNR